jgi:hypothetical protein
MNARLRPQIAMKHRKAIYIAVPALALVLVSAAMTLSGRSKSDSPSLAAMSPAEMTYAAASASPRAEAEPAPARDRATPNAIAEVRARAIRVTTRLRVAHVDEVARAVREAAERQGGYVASGNLSGNSLSRTAQFELKVPAARFSAFMATLHDAGETTHYAETSEDVTEQATDLAARLRNARAQEKRMLEIMASRTASLAETFEAERELARVREGIERLDAAEKGLANRVAFVTITMTLEMIAAPVAAAPRPLEVWETPGSSIAQSAKDGARAAASLFTYLAMALAAVLPVLLPLSLPLVALFYFLRARRRRLAEAATSAA